MTGLLLATLRYCLHKCRSYASEHEAMKGSYPYMKAGTYGGKRAMLVAEETHYIFSNWLNQAALPPVTFGEFKSCTCGPPCFKDVEYYIVRRYDRQTNVTKSVGRDERGGAPESVHN